MLLQGEMPLPIYRSQKITYMFSQSSVCCARLMNDNNLAIVSQINKTCDYYITIFLPRFVLMEFEMKKIFFISLDCLLRHSNN